MNKPNPNEGVAVFRILSRNECPGSSRCNGRSLASGAVICKEALGVAGQRNLLVPGGELLNGDFRFVRSAHFTHVPTASPVLRRGVGGQPSFGREINLPVHPLPG